MHQEVLIRIRPWPWSIAQNSYLWKEGDLLKFPFYGSPIIEVASGVEMFLPARHEKFIPFGAEYTMAGGAFCLYEAPHGVLSETSEIPSKPSKITLRCQNRNLALHLSPNGAEPRQKKDNTDTELVATVLSWSQFFDDCQENEPSYSWKGLKWFKDYQDETHEPRMALIIRIAEKMEKRLETILQRARKILVRERILLPAGRIDETDIACLQWYIRQPGTSAAQKAAANRQTLLGIARRESYDTLENRVLKAFTLLCVYESRRYLDREVGQNERLRNSARGKKVRRFQHLCAQLAKHPVLDSVKELHGRVQPNYVLQNDQRYLEVWRNYLRLLRQEDEEDQLWDWQARTWADVVRLLCHAALYTALEIQPLKHSRITFHKEQLLGSRVLEGTEPGPFLITISATAEWVLEIVHPDLLNEHELVRGLSRLGAHLYLVLRKLNSHEVRIIVIWAVHAIASKQQFSWQAISQDAANALQAHSVSMSKTFKVPPLKGLVVVNTIHKDRVELEIARGGVPIMFLPTNPNSWKMQLEDFGSILLTQMEEVLK